MKDMHETKNAARKEASDAEQRRSVRARQRAIGAGGGVVMEGRDIGTVVFPEADVKVYPDDSAE